MAGISEGRAEGCPRCSHFWEQIVAGGGVAALSPPPLAVTLGGDRWPGGVGGGLRSTSMDNNAENNNKVETECGEMRRFAADKTRPNQFPVPHPHLHADADLSTDFLFKSSISIGSRLTDRPPSFLPAGIPLESGPRETRRHQRIRQPRGPGGRRRRRRRRQPRPQRQRIGHGLGPPREPR